MKKPRHHLYLDEETTKRLDQLVQEKGASRSAILGDAMRAFLSNRAATDLDTHFRRRLDRISNHLQRVERDQQVILETFALFVEHQLSLTAHHPEPDQAMRAIGEGRFQTFVDQVSRRVARGRTPTNDVIPLREAANA